MSNKKLETPKVQQLFAKDLTLSKNNPRFPAPVHSEEQAILKFLELKKVGPKKIKNLIDDIAQNQRVFEDFVVLKKNNSLIVHDGNRRLTALKLFTNEYNKLIKDKYTNLYNHINDTKNRINISKLPLLVKVYTDEESMANHVRKLHTGEQGGAGQIKWDRKEKDTFEKNHFSKPESTGVLIYKKIEKDPDKKDLFNKIKGKELSSTIDRFLGVSDIKKRIFRLKYGKNIDINKTENFDKICEMINLFIGKNASVGDVYTKDKTIEFFKNIEPISEVQVNKTTPENNQLVLDMDDELTKINRLPKEITTPRVNPPIVPLISPPKQKRQYNKRQTKPKDREYPFKGINYKGNVVGISQTLYELHQIEVNKFPFSSTVLIRTLLECTIQEYILIENIQIKIKKNESIKNLSIDSLLKTCTNESNGNFKVLRKNNNVIARIMNEANNKRDADELNMVAHGNYREPSKKALWDIERRWYSAVEFMVKRINGHPQ